MCQLHTLPPVVFIPISSGVWEILGNPAAADSNPEVILSLAVRVCVRLGDLGRVLGTSGFYAKKIN